MNFSDIKTKSQKERVVAEAVKSLAKLVDSEERKDLLKEIFIADIDPRCESSSQLKLARKGLFERYFHRSYDMLDNPETEVFDDKVSKENYAEIIEKYKLTSERIEKIYRSLK